MSTVGWVIPPASELAFEHDFRTVFDIGGNVGAYAEEAHRQWPRALLLSFEPLSDIANENERRARGRWTTVHMGVAEDVGPRFINRNLSNPGSSTLLTPGGVRRDVFGLEEKYERELVMCTSLDALMQGPIKVEPPALMKIDVEGAELSVLQGGPRTVPQFDTVVIELNGPGIFERAPSAEEIDARMREYGFRLVGSAGELRHPDDNTILQWDGVWVRGIQ